MKITITNFFSIKNVDFSIEKGITVIAGKNGSGKSQLLLGIAQKNSSRDLLSEFGFSHHAYDCSLPQIIIDPMPKLVLYRPAIRHLAENNKEQEFAFCRPLNTFINSNDENGYLYNVQNRSRNIYAIISNFAIAANNTNATSLMKERWGKLVSSFEKVFAKELTYDINIFHGIKVGVKIEKNRICSLNTLSTGELEFISLMCDLLLEQEIIIYEGEIQERDLITNKLIPKADMILIDELDVHFHPDLQQKILKIINELCADKYIIITTHSPSIMLSASPDKLFYMTNNTECRNKNQLCKVSDDISMYFYLSEMYKGFVDDVNLSKHFSHANNKVILTYAKQCLIPAGVVEKASDIDPQTATIRSALLYKKATCIVEVGTGKGRLLNAFKGYKNESLSKITYYAVEPNGDYHEEINRKIIDFELQKKFKEIILVRKLPKDAKKIDICFIVNVIHEITPIDLADFFNEYISFCNPDAIISILEVGVLTVGEEYFILFYPEAFVSIFQHYVGKVSLIYNEHNTPKGWPLYDVSLRINKTDFRISYKDIILGLDKIIEIETAALYNHYSNKKLSAIEYAFRTHNLANAQTYRTFLIKDKNRNL